MRQVSRNHLFLVLLLAIAVGLLLSACTGEDSLHNQSIDMQQKAPMGDHVPPDMRDGGIIPNYAGPKTETTNMQGATTSGLGMNIYSTIGSSGLHEGGISAHIQSRMNGLGNEGIKVFVLNDTVLLASKEEVIPSNKLNAVQKKLLSPTEGMSGKGDPEGIPFEPEQPQNNLELAKQQVSEMFGGNVQVLTVTDPRSFELIDRIAAKLHDGNVHDPSIAQDIAALLGMVKESDDGTPSAANK